MLSTTEAPETSADIALADFFSGCGGTTRGFADAGISPLLAVDWDRDAVETFRLNFPTTPVIEQDIREVGVEEVGDLLRPTSESVMLFAGCAPCQPFAGHRRQPPDQDSRSFLLNEFLRFVTALNPELIFVENVPGMQRVSASEGPFADFPDPRQRRPTLRHRHRLGHGHLGEALCQGVLGGRGDREALTQRARQT